jgi:NhaP-type Na+/H+ or K+/H+ antiporter
LLHGDSVQDPVAVVALFHTLGVSPRLTMLVSGESLLNDGTAIVVFTLVFKLVLGVPFEIWSSVGFFCHMTFSALALGVVVGLAAVGLIGLCSEGEQTSDAILQVTISICCGYVAFLIGELQVKTSGVISTVCAGFVFALFAWPRFISRETIRTVWETIEFIANTIIFFLAGVLFANTILERWGLIGLSDVWWCLALWFALTAIRVLTVVILWLPLNKVGNPITFNDAIVMVWSGMRGAVSLCLAIIVDMEPRISKEMGSRIMFHVGGVATLTILVNATTAPAILRVLGITKSSHVKERMLSCFAKTLAHQAATEFKQESQIEEDVRFRGANESIVREMMRPPSGVEVVPEDVGGFTDVSEKALLMIYREMHLKVVQTQYWEAIDAGILPRNLYAARILLQSVDKALDDASTGLTDWTLVMRGLQAEDVEEPGRLVRFLGGLAEGRPFVWSTTFRRWFSKDFRAKRAVLVILSFQEAHLEAQKQVPKYLDMEDAFDVKVHQQIRQESALECEQAADFLRRLPAQDVEMAKSEMLARKLLNSQIKHINEMEEKGVLSSFEAGHLQAHCLASLRKLGSSTKATWLEAVEK